MVGPPPLEPFRIKTVQPFRLTTRKEREGILRRARYNLFSVRAADCMIDLLTDSGTSALSDSQWAALMRGDESYAGSRSFDRFETAVRDLTGFAHIIPTHQGRAAERILFSLVGGKGRVIPSNAHFDTTRANIAFSGAEAVDLRIPQASDPRDPHPFKGNADLDALARLVKRLGRRRIPIGMLTVTNNTVAGQPASLDNIRGARQILSRAGIPLYLDGCRFAENAWLIKQRDPVCRSLSARRIAREMFRLADGCVVSAKKDALCNTGGFLATNDADLAERARNLLILTEGFPTYGGMAARDLEAVARGLSEALDEDYLAYRTDMVAWMTEALHERGIPVFRPPGGHAVYLDAGAFLPHVPRRRFPAQALACELYLEGGIRSVEIGSVMFGKGAQMELVRLALPRRAYTQSHLRYVLDVVARVYAYRARIPGYRILREPPSLRHFTVHFAPCMPKKP